MHTGYVFIFKPEVLMPDPVKQQFQSLSLHMDTCICSANNLKGSV